ncbi:DUF7319 domain-containing protein [Halomicrobium urmianum]|uniref:DUF7319 domain-containing protein n=1 Tax=Halomicrobium urmianum TaxID=1586233 RepID=UPI001CD98913|nr:hypothetical protein [Halomicrobium urmianum]
MSDAEDERAGDSPGADGDGESLQALRERVETEYDFENFGPADMAEMSADEWEAAFDPDTWITGQELLDRVEADLRSRVADRDVFARVERHEDPPRVLAYSESSYALVYPDGSVEGEGTVLRDVKPTVALASMESYDVPDAPEGRILPSPGDVPEGGGELGNTVIQVIAVAQGIAGLLLLGAGVFSYGETGSNAVGMAVAGLAFLAVAVVLFVVVANARLSDKFRAEEYRERLRAVGLEDGERPDFLPPLEADGESGADEGEREA